MSMSISVRVLPITKKMFARQRSHDARIGRIPPYVDTSMTHENSVLVHAPDANALFKDLAQRRKAAGQQALRKDARIAVSGIITFGRDAQETIKSLIKSAQDDLYLSIANAIANYTGHELIGLYVHRDEAAPHAHFVLSGYRKGPDNKLIPWRFSRSTMSRLQDIAAQCVTHLGIKRGTPKTVRLARGEPLHKLVHRTVRQLHEDLPIELDRVKEQIRELEERIEVGKQTINQLKAYRTLLRNEVKRLEQQYGDIKKLEAEKEILEKQLELLNKTINKICDRIVQRGLQKQFGDIPLVSMKVKVREKTKNSETYFELHNPTMFRDRR